MEVYAVVFDTNFVKNYSVIKMILTWAIAILLFGRGFCGDSTYPKHVRAARTTMFGVKNLVYNSGNSSLILGTVLNKIAVLKNVLQNKLRTFSQGQEVLF